MEIMKYDAGDFKSFEKKLLGRWWDNIGIIMEDCGSIGGNTGMTNFRLE